MQVFKAGRGRAVPGKLLKRPGIALDFARRAGLPYETARTRIELATLLADQCRAEEALEQALRAEEDLRRLGATRDADLAAAIAGGVDPC